eukprot:jgi/Tetstr1/438804/TSEL_027313.t1
MPAGPSSHASAATTRVSTQLQDLESKVKYLRKRATASEEAERCWREVVNSSEPLPAVITKERSSSSIMAMSTRMELTGEEAGLVEEADLVGEPADRLINLDSSKWDPDMEMLVLMVKQEKHEQAQASPKRKFP